MVLGGGDCLGRLSVHGWLPLWYVHFQLTSAKRISLGFRAALVLWCAPWRFLFHLYCLRIRRVDSRASDVRENHQLVGGGHWNGRNSCFARASFGSWRFRDSAA